MVKGEYINIRQRKAGAGWHSKCHKCLEGRALGYCSAMIRAAETFKAKGITQFDWDCPRYKTDENYRLIDELGIADGKTVMQLVGISP